MDPPTLVFPAPPPSGTSLTTFPYGKKDVRVSALAKRDFAGLRALRRRASQNEGDLSEKLVKMRGF